MYLRVQILFGKQPDQASPAPSSRWPAAATCCHSAEARAAKGEYAAKRIWIAETVAQDEGLGLSDNLRESFVLFSKFLLVLRHFCLERNGKKRMQATAE